MKPNPNISKHNPATHGGIRHDIPTDVLDFSSNVNPLGLDFKVKQTIRNNLDLFGIYPDLESKLIKDALSKYTDTSPSRIVIGNGATEIIYNFCNAFLSDSVPVLIPIPTFAEYETAAKLAGAKISFYNDTPNTKKFLTRIPKNGCIFLCNPNNPTGTLLNKDEIRTIIDYSKQYNTTVFVDECFIELVPNYNESVINLVEKYQNLIILRSLTKSFALAGMRIGYCITSKYMAKILDKIKIPWNVSNIIHKVVPTILADLSYLEKARKLIYRESIFLNQQISKIDGFTCYNTHTNFILIKTEMDSTLLQKRLLDKKILIRDCKSFRGLTGNHIRVAVKTRKENKRLVEALYSCRH